MVLVSACYDRMSMSLYHFASIVFGARVSLEYEAPVHTTPTVKALSGSHKHIYQPATSSAISPTRLSIVTKCTSRAVLMGAYISNGTLVFAIRPSYSHDSPHGYLDAIPAD